MRLAQYPEAKPSVFVNYASSVLCPPLLNANLFRSSGLCNTNYKWYERKYHLSRFDQTNVEIE